MSRTYEQLLEHSVEIDAPPERVWDLVSDVRRMPEWSPSVTSTRLRSGYERVELGTEFTNLNVLGELEWKTHGTVVRFDVERKIAFRIEENWVVWSFTLDPAAHGTRLTQRRETPEGISELSLELTDGFMGGQEEFTRTLHEGMRETLGRIRSEAEQP
jgi:uncharacterized protein YndB with AHSA1/START domain